jgi:hypothetical protein
VHLKYDVYCNYELYLSLNFPEYLWIVITSKLYGAYYDLCILKVFACHDTKLYGLDFMIATDRKCQL